MTRRYVVTALGPDGKVIVQATHDTPADTIGAFYHLIGDPQKAFAYRPALVRRLMLAWLKGEEIFEVPSDDFTTTCSITIIDE
jgi:hypothetical protein